MAQLKWQPFRRWTYANLFNDAACKGHEYGHWFSTGYVGCYAEVCKHCHHRNEFDKDYT